ncbi:MAG: hypothetical protein L6R40_008429, partial [Gallowayella cf. fulva]
MFIFSLHPPSPPKPADLICMSCCLLIILAEAVSNNAGLLLIQPHSLPFTVFLASRHPIKITFYPLSTIPFCPALEQGPVVIMLASGPVGVLLALFVASLTYSFSKLYAARSLIWERQKRGLPVAPNHSFLFGHLLYFKAALKSLPPNAHYQNALGDIARQHFQHEGCYYIDMWPISGVILVNVSPHVATQIHANPEMSMQRPPLLPRFFRPIAGGPNLFDMREHEWKPWRAVFSKAFSAEHILSLVPDMVDETMVYSSTLEKLAREDSMIHLDLITLRYTIDVIGKTILNAHLGAQEGYNALADCMLSQIRWHQANADVSPFEYFNLIRKTVHWWNGRQMDKYISSELTKRYMEHKADIHGKRTKAIIDLVLQTYASDSHEASHAGSSDSLDPDFRAFAICQIRLFVFVGHDSTSSTICYIMHLLNANPEALARLRREHDGAFGTEVKELPSLLKSQPQIINNLPYTTAVVKEALRLFPPGGSSRAGKSNVSLLTDSGKSCPTEDTAAVFTIHTELQRSPAYWKQPDAFLPDRWLAKPDDELYPLKGAYRAFEIGPRNCVAQTFVMTELKVVLACLVRQFDFTPAYEEFD